jgi:hypothetical protein
MKQKILDQLNEFIVEEKGTPVTMKSKWTDANLDSLGTMMVIISMEADYPIFGDNPDVDWLAILDFPNLTIRRYIKLCISSITNTSEGQSSKTES